MAASDDDYSTESEGEDDLSIANDVGDDEEEAPRKRARRGGSGASNEKKTTKAHFPRNLQAIAQLKNSINTKLKGSTITEELSLRVIRRVLELLETHIRERDKNKGKEDSRLVRLPLRDTICREYGIGKTTYSQITLSYFPADTRRRQVYVTGMDGLKPGNTKSKQTRIPRTVECILQTQKFVRDMRAKRQRVTARQVLDFLIANEVLMVPVAANGTYQARAFATAYRATRRFVESLGYERGRRTGNLVPKKSVLLKKAHYLQLFVANRKKPVEERLREVYLDESYIHQHYHRNDDSLWDPNDDQDVQVSKAPGKGRRYCFLAAIQGPNPRAPVLPGEPLDRMDMAGLVPGSVWAFSPQLKKQHQGDYHKVFNGENFLAWWRNQLLPNLAVPSLIILDNAAYHCVYDDDVPKPSRMKKQEMIDFLKSKGEVEEPVELLTALQWREKTKEYIKREEKIAIIKTAEEAGHEVLFTPPYHSDLQPIELVWAYIKGNVGRQYNNETTMDLVYSRLMQEFEQMLTSGHERTHGMIEKCARLAMEMHEEMLQEDGVDEYESGEDSGDDQDAQEESKEEEETPGGMGEGGEGPLGHETAAV